MLFPMTPDVLHRIQFRSVCRKVFDLDVAAQTRKMVPHDAAAVGRQAVPDDQQRTVNVANESLQEIDDLGTLNGTRIEPEIETPKRQAGHRGQDVPVEIVLQHRRLAARRPRSAAVWPLTYSALVDEDDRAALLAGFFFMAGHCFLRQFRISSSLRSRARPVGRCGLQPSDTSSFQTCPSW